MATQTLGPRFGLPRIMILIKPITPIRIHTHPQIFNLVLLFKLIWRFLLRAQYDNETNYYIDK